MFAIRNKDNHSEFMASDNNSGGYAFKYTLRENHLLYNDGGYGGFRTIWSTEKEARDYMQANNNYQADGNWEIVKITQTMDAIV